MEETDVLRAAVVFLHATHEDLLRSLLEWKLPGAPAKYLADIPLQGKPARTKFTLDDLAAHRGSTVDDLIARSVLQSLKRSNFNHPGEIERALDKIGLDKDLLKLFKPQLGPLMARRHLIVHRADHSADSPGRGSSFALALHQKTVELWHEALREFGTNVLNELQEIP